MSLTNSHSLSSLIEESLIFYCIKNRIHFRCNYEISIHFINYNGKNSLGNLIDNIKIIEDLNYGRKVHIKNNIILKRFENSTYI